MNDMKTLNAHRSMNSRGDENKEGGETQENVRGNDWLFINEEEQRETHMKRNATNAFLLMTQLKPLYNEEENPERMVNLNELCRHDPPNDDASPTRKMKESAHWARFICSLAP